MRCWARLAIATAAAEFPEFTVMHAMSVFSLRPVDIADSRHLKGSVVCAGSANIAEKLKTLADAFAIDPHVFSAQYHTVYGIVQTTASSSLNCGDREAWRRALVRCMRSKGSYVNVSELVVVARAWLGWNSHTCDIERAFSQVQAIFSSNRRTSMSRQREQDIVTLCADWRKHEEAAVVSAAVELWKGRCYNIRSEMKQGKLVVAHRQRQKQAGSKPTMSEFASVRRKEVSNATQNTTSPIVSKRKLHELTKDAWTPEMQKEETI